LKKPKIDREEAWKAPMGLLIILPSRKRVKSAHALKKIKSGAMDARVLLLGRFLRAKRGAYLESIKSFCVFT
jgi:hypothetical protein